MGFEGDSIGLTAGRVNNIAHIARLKEVQL